jgi:hypothetical protein
MSDPLYVSDYGRAEISLELPGIMNGTHAYLLAFTGDPVAMQSVVDTFLNAPAQGAVEYSVLGNQAFFAFLHVDQLTSNLELLGYTTDHECGVWIPLLARGGGPDRIVIWMPYIIIDWQQGMATGREVLGYRKTMGTVEMPTDPKQADRFVVSTNVFPTFSQTTKEIFEPLITIERQGTGSFSEEWTEAKHALEGLLHVWTRGLGELHANRWQVAANIAELLVTMEIPIVNLKQFRAAHDTTRACYQAIIECGIGIHGFHGAGLLGGDYMLNITQVASHRIAQDLGLTLPAKADFAMWLHLDMSADPGREVFRA